ncbi:MAG: hypothetical protein NTV16_00505 [Actinobacteria bacterium]|nr:hypothetical protein [Actinomycetota bacterium]
MLSENKPDQSYDVPLALDGIDHLQKIIDEAKLKFKKLKYLFYEDILCKVIKEFKDSLKFYLRR